MADKMSGKVKLCLTLASGGRYEKMRGRAQLLVGIHTVREVHSEHAGSGGMSPRKFLKNICYEIEPGGTFSAKKLNWSLSGKTYTKHNPSNT